MNKFFVGRAYGVREKKEVVVPKALEDKEFMFNKTKVANEKSERVGLKMKDFNNKLKSKGNKLNFKLPSKHKVNINFKSGNMSHSNKTNSMMKNMFNSKDNKVSLNKMKAKSDMFLNTKYNKKNPNPVMNEKLNMYSIGKLDYKKKNLEKFTGRLKGAAGKKYKLPIKDFSSKNQQYSLTPRSNEVGDLGYDKVVNVPSDSDRIDSAKRISPEMLNSKINRVNSEPTSEKLQTYTREPEAGSTNMGLFTVDKNPEATDKTSESLFDKGMKTGKSGLDYMTGKAKDLYNSSDYAKNRELDKEYEKMRLDAKDSLLNDPSVKADMFTRMQLNERAKLLRSRKADSTLGRFAAGAGEFKAAINTALPNVSTDRFKELSGFRVGRGFSYMGQSQIAGPGFRYSVAANKMKKPGVLKIAEMTSGVTKQPVPQYNQMEEPMMLPEPATRTVSSVQGPAQQASFKDVQKQYLEALIKRRMESGRELGAKGTAKLLNDIDRLNQPDRPPEQKKVSQQYYTPQQANNARGYKNRKVHPDFGKKVIVNGEEKIISAYGKPVDFIRGPYNKLDTSSVEMTEVQQLN